MDRIRQCDPFQASAAGRLEEMATQAVRDVQDTELRMPTFGEG
jgi:hypothetical protein